MLAGQQQDFHETGTKKQKKTKHETAKLNNIYSTRINDILTMSKQRCLNFFSHTTVLENKTGFIHLPETP